MSLGGRFGDEPKKVAEDWLRNFCETSDCPGFDVIMQAISGGHASIEDDYGYVRHEGDYIFVSGYDAHGSIPPEFWDYAEVYLDKKFDSSERSEYFSCSC